MFTRSVPFQLFVCITLTTFLTGMVYAQGAEFGRLDELLQAGRSVELAGELRSPAYPKSEMVEWLKRRAEEGHVLTQYELASRLAATDKRDALKWYARGRLGWILDEAECKPSEGTNSLGFALELAYQPLDRLARENEALFLAGMEEALESEHKGGARPSPKWVCDPEGRSVGDDSLLPAEARAKARAQAQEKLARGKNNLTQQVQAANMLVNPDRFPIRNPPGFRLRGGGESVGYPPWLDENQLLVVGSLLGVEGLYIWDVRESAPKLYRAGVKAARYNARAAIVMYSVGGTGEIEQVYRGPLGKETEIPKWLRPFEESAPSMVERRRGHTARYSVFERGFVELDEHASGARDKPLTVRVWHDDKRITETQIPPGPWFHGSIFVDISRQGVVMGSDAGGRRPASVGSRGLYLINNGTIKRLVAKEIRNISVSPDGCNVAYVEAPLNEGLRVVNVCLKGN